MDIRGPERRLVAADALAHLDDDVLGVGRVALDQRELQLLLEGAQALLQLGQHLPEVGVGPGRLDVVAYAAPLERKLVRAFELLQPPPGVGRLAVIVVDGRVGQALLRLRVRALELLDQLIHRGHRGRL